jgi:hypothetical protein
MKNSVISRKIKAELPSKIDCMLVCASYEDRCLSVNDSFESSHIASLCLLHFSKYQHLSRVHIEKYTANFNVHSYELDISRPTTTADALIDYFSAILSKVDHPNVVVDISTFTRESLLITIKYLQVNKEKLGDVYIFYRVAEASTQLSEEVVQVRSVLGYMGDFISERPLHLILLSGFEYERAKEIIENLEPDFISIGYGDKDKSISPSSYERNKEFTDKLLGYYSPELVNVFCHSLRDPNEVRIDLKNIIEARSDCNVVLAPLNNKLSTVGAGLAAIDNPGVQVCYAEVASYNETAYSNCKDDCFIYRLEI